MTVLIGSQVFGWLGFGAFVAYVGALAAYDTARHIRWKAAQQELRRALEGK